MNDHRWFESQLPIQGANRLGFTKPIIVQSLIWSREPTGREIASNAMALLKLKEGDVLVDLGCGPGLIVAHMLSCLGQDGKLICVDASTPMLESAVGILPAGNVEFIHGDIHHVASLIPKRSVDGAILSGNVHLLTNKQLAFGQIRTILKPNGQLVVVTHVKYSWDRGRGDIYPRLVEKTRGERPDLFADGLRLPMLTELELEQHIRIIEDSGFVVQAYENDSWSGDTYQVLGLDPALAIRKRLKLLDPGMSDVKVESTTQSVIEDIWSGRPAQVYLLCTNNEVL